MFKLFKKVNPVHTGCGAALTAVDLWTEINKEKARAQEEQKRRKLDFNAYRLLQPRLTPVDVVVDDEVVAVLRANSSLRCF